MMSYKEAANRIEDHMYVHHMQEGSRCEKITEALGLAVESLRNLAYIQDGGELILAKGKGLMKRYSIYEEGFAVMEGSGCAHYVGDGYGETFLDACREFISRSGRGEIRVDDLTGEEYACDWGCRWFPTLAEAAASFG